MEDEIFEFELKWNVNDTMSDRITILFYNARTRRIINTNGEEVSSLIHDDILNKFECISEFDILYREQNINEILN